MKRIISIAIGVGLAACATPPTEAVTTTSAQATSTRRAPDSDGLFDLGSPLLREEPAPVNPRAARDLDLAADAARARDTKISGAIVRAIVNDPSLSPRAKHIDVETHGRHVTLQGNVPTGQERQEIDAMARFTDDVLDVDDRIVIVP